jgi:DNA-binding ferritin-like protein
VLLACSRHGREFARNVARMSPAPAHDPIAALNEVLSEVIDGVQEVKQARWRVATAHPLHAVLDELFDDLTAWARLLIEEDKALGISPLTRITSVAGRKPPNLWSGAATDEEVRRVLDQQLDRLGQHVTAALSEQADNSSRTALADIQRGLRAHRRALSQLSQ